jgi:hypothetical protein
MTTEEALYAQAVQIAVLETKLESLTSIVYKQQQSLDEIKELLQQVKGGYRVGSTIIMVAGTIAGMLISLVFKRLF